MPDNSVGPDPRQRLRDIQLFASEHGWNGLTGSDAQWLANEIERLQAIADAATEVVESAYYNKDGDYALRDGLAIDTLREALAERNAP